MKLKIVMDQWIRAAGRDGLKQLSDATKIPTSSLSKIRNGRVPQNPLVRESLCKALGFKESELFPAPTGKSRAS
jgi:hypothetical protein